MADVIFEFLWEGYKPDQRQYRNQSVELMPLGSGGTSVLIAVTVPLGSDLIANSDKIITATLDGSTKPDPILTLAGMKYVIDMFDETFNEKEKAAETKEEDDWGDDLPQTSKSGTTSKSGATSKSAPAEEDWDNDTKSPTEAPWDESTEEWQ